MISYHSKKPSLLLESGTAAEHARYHDDGSGEDQYVGRCSIGLGGEKANVVALLQQGPNAHPHHNNPCQLEEKARRQTRLSAAAAAWTNITTKTLL